MVFRLNGVNYEVDTEDWVIRDDCGSIAATLFTTPKALKNELGE